MNTLFSLSNILRQNMILLYERKNIEKQGVFSIGFLWLGFLFPRKQGEFGYAVNIFRRGQNLRAFSVGFLGLYRFSKPFILEIGLELPLVWE